MLRIAHFLRLMCIVLAMAAGSAQAEEIEVRDAELRATEEGLTLNADFSFELNARLTEALTNGIPLYFVVDFELTRPRWYWFDEKTLAKRMQQRLS